MSPRPLFLHDHEGSRDSKAFAIMETRRGAATVLGAAVLGVAALALPLAWAPGWAYALASAGALAVLAAAFARWRPGASLAVAAAILTCALSRAGSIVLTAEGLLILAYLLAADAPPGLTRPGGWVRHQAFLGVAGLVASGAVLAALALHQVSSAALTVAGLAAAAGAYLIALPSARAARRDSGALPSARAARRDSGALPPVPAARRDSDVDVQ
jgi:hypothetical protein